MANSSPDEVVFAVAGSAATAAERIGLADAGLREREHLHLSSASATALSWSPWSQLQRHHSQVTGSLGSARCGALNQPNAKPVTAHHTIRMRSLVLIATS
jgi:hypothetical protein